MKNVAGYDVSRLLAGSLGTLGLVVEVSLKVMPLASAEQTLCFELPGENSQSLSLVRLNQWGGQPLPISASAWVDGVLHIRLSGAVAAVNAAAQKLGGERVEPEAATAFWSSLREQSHAFFTASQASALWRLAVPATTPPLALAGAQLIEWGGAQRWLHAAGADHQATRQAAAQAGGHATLFRADSATKVSVGVFQPLAAPLARIHRQLKAAFDAPGIFNPGRMYPEF
jgi:glycolate oxidase FAD binding subunit